MIHVINKKLNPIPYYTTHFNEEVKLIDTVAHFGEVSAGKHHISIITLSFIIKCHVFD